MDKKNFEKDIDVPSKRRIMDDYNAKDCEQCSPDSVCCYCKNIAYYNLEEQLKNEKHSHEHTKVWIGEYIKKHPYRKDEYEQLKAENVELKKQYKELGQCSKSLKDYYEKEKETLSNRFLKLKQALTEIKEIAESEMDSKEFMAVQAMLNGSVDNKNKVLEQILQKISEVEDERNG